MGAAKFGGAVLVLTQNHCGFSPPALPETQLSFPRRIRDVFMFQGLSGNLKPGEFGQGWALAGTGLRGRAGQGCAQAGLIFVDIS